MKLFALILMLIVLAGCQSKPAPQQALLTAQANVKPVFYCGALTKLGKPCRNRVAHEGDHCHLHQESK